MKKKIIKGALFIFYISLTIQNAFGLEFQVKSSLDSYESVQLFGTGSKIGGGGYFFRYGYHYNEGGNGLGGIPGGGNVMQDYNDRKKTVIDTQYYWFYINSSNSGSSGYDVKQMIVVNKKTGEIYSKRFTGNFYSNYSGSSYIPFFFYEGTVILRLGSSNEWYFFDKGNIEFNIAPGIKPYTGYVTPLTIQGKPFYYANENGSDIYTLYGDTFRGYQFAYDGNGNILRAFTDLTIQNNLPYTRYRINKSNGGVFYISLVNTSNTTVWMRGYDTNNQSWIEYPGKYMLYYNPEVGYGWTVGDYPTIPYYISETGKFASIGKWNESLLKYVKYYQKTNKSLYTNDIPLPNTNTNNTNPNPPNDFSSGSTTTSTGTIFDPNTSSGTTNIGSGTTDTGGGGIIDTSTGNTTDNSGIIGNGSNTSGGTTIDTSGIISSLLGLFGTKTSDLNNLKNSLSGALDTGTSGFSVGTGGTSGINYTPGNSDYGNIINRNDNQKTCDMFNGDGSFAYYSNGSYDLSIDLNGLLDLGYVDKVPFLEELLFIPNKILSFITNPLNNIFSTLRVFGGIGENTYCYFGTLQTIEFQKHIKIGTSFWGGEFIFTPGDLTIIDYLILFFMGIPMLILTVKILLY